MLKKFLVFCVLCGCGTASGADKYPLGTTCGGTTVQSPTTTATGRTKLVVRERLTEKGLFARIHDRRVNKSGKCGK